MYITVSEILLSISRSAHIQKQNMITELTSTSYNPCSNGILINMVVTNHKTSHLGLNPCSNGILINQKCSQQRSAPIVLILVLMEYS